MPDVGRSRASPHLLPAPPSTHPPWPRGSGQIQQQLTKLGKLGEAEQGSRPTLLCPLPHLLSLSLCSLGSLADPPGCRQSGAGSPEDPHPHFQKACTAAPPPHQHPLSPTAPLRACPLRWPSSRDCQLCSALSLSAKEPDFLPLGPLEALCICLEGGGSVEKSGGMHQTQAACLHPCTPTSHTSSFLQGL